MADKSIIERIYTEFVDRVPIPVAAEILGISPIQYRSGLHKRSLQYTRGKCTTDRFIFKQNIDDFPWLTADYRRKYRAIWKQATYEYSRKLCRKKKLRDQDCCPAEFLEQSYTYLPGVVGQGLFEIGEKQITKLKKLLGLMQNRSRQRGVQDTFYATEDPLAPPCLSRAQLIEFKQVVLKLKAAYHQKLQDLSSQSANKLLQAMISSKARSTEPLYKCRGKYCKSQWPRNSECYYKTFDTPDGLQHFCKYCSLLKNQNRPKRKKKVPRTKALNESQQQRAIIVISSLTGKIPTLYLLKLLGITIKQFTRLVRLAGVSKQKLGGSNKLLQQWRAKSEIPNFKVLRNAEKDRLNQIWQTDFLAYLKALEHKDKEDVQVLANEMVNINLHGLAIRKNGLHRCEGGCGCTYYIDKFFFPNVAGRFKYFCVVCNRKRKRQKVWQY